MSDFINRFEGTDGTARLIAALRQQKCIGRDPGLAEQLAAFAKLESFNEGDVLIEEDGPDTDVFFILVGAVRICVRGRELAKRSAGTHVGEMVCIDPQAVRCASVKAMQPTVVAKIAASDFEATANEHPQLWRAFACELSERLRQRNMYVRPFNETPRVFIASSAEGKAVARAIQVGLDYEDMIAETWMDDVFEASNFALEDLEAKAQQADFMVIVATPDDETLSRGTRTSSPRDNIVFEHGIGIGSVGRRRTILIVPRGVSIKLPSDIEGMKPLTYKDGDTATLAARLAPACDAIAKRVRQEGAR